MLKLVTRFSMTFVGPVVVGLGLVGLMPAIATAPAPPQLVQAKLKGQPVYVLYMTRSRDKVLVRCYPGQQPKVEVATRADGVKEGTLTCGQ